MNLQCLAGVARVTVGDLVQTIRFDDPIALFLELVLLARELVCEYATMFPCPCLQLASTRRIDL